MTQVCDKYVLIYQFYLSFFASFSLLFCFYTVQLYCCASVQYFQMTQQCLPQEEGLKKEMNTELLLPHTHRLGHVLCALHHDALGTPLSFFNMHTVQCNRISEIDTRLQAKRALLVLSLLVTKCAKCYPKFVANGRIVFF